VTKTSSLAILVLSLVSLIKAIPALAGCVQPGTTTKTLSWEPNEIIYVIVTGFPKPQDVQTSYTNWNNAIVSTICSSPAFSGQDTTSPYRLSISYAPINPVNGKTIRGQTTENSFDTGGRELTATTVINSAVTTDATITQVVTHEIGHTFALNDCNLCGINSTVMEAGDQVSSINSQISPAAPTTCDVAAVALSYPCPSGGGCTLQTCGAATYCPGSPCGNGGTQYCCTDGGGTHPCCTTGSPIIIDVANEGFHLTGLSEGVRFPNEIGDAPANISWTDPRFHNAWLALDRNGNGTIDALSELFGNYTPQPPSSDKNGFAALAVFDDPKNGGNGDGIIDPEDAVYSSLRLWVDKNQDGISQPEELFRLPEAGLFSISLHYQNDSRTDQYGNQFRYKSSIVDLEDRSREGCYDVFLLEEMP
jgi:hypothetical protein